MPRYVQYYDLISYGRGYTWREANGGDTDDHVTRRIMFENNQGWTVVNCTWKFPAGDPDRGGVCGPCPRVLVFRDSWTRYVDVT